MNPNEVRHHAVNWEFGMLVAPEHFLRQERFYLTHPVLNPYDQPESKISVYQRGELSPQELDSQRANLAASGCRMEKVRLHP